MQPRRKGGLETPLRGRFAGESKKLTFAPPAWYDGLVMACIFGGITLLLFDLLVGHSGYWLWVSVLIAFAGGWGAISSERIICDLRSRTYVRLEGHGLGMRVRRGSLSDLDALVLMSEEYIFAVHGRSVIYRLVLHWKGRREPLLVVERVSRHVSSGAPLNSGAAEIGGRGTRFAAALGVPFYDNSYMSAPPPVPVV